MQGKIHFLVPTQADDFERLVDEREAAGLLGLSRSFLRRLRIAGEGCEYSYFGTAVRYRRGDLIAWAASRKVNSTTQRGPAK